MHIHKLPIGIQNIAQICEDNVSTNPIKNFASAPVHLIRIMYCTESRNIVGYELKQV